jgi:hypothetical protein
MILRIFAMSTAVLAGNKLRLRANLLTSIGIILVAYLVVGGVG